MSIAAFVGQFYHAPNMNTSKLAWFLLPLALLFSSFVSGCGGGSSNEKVNVQAQIENLKSPDSETRVNACVELAKAGPDAAVAVPSLIPLLKDADALVRRLAAHALGQIGPSAKSAIPALKDAARDRDSAVMTEAIDAIQQIDPEAAAGLKRLPNVTN